MADLLPSQVQLGIQAMRQRKADMIHQGRAEALPESPDHGTQAATKNFYRKHSREPWKEWAPDIEELDAERARNAKFALLVRREQDANSETGLSLQSITIQSPHLRKLMEEVFEDYPSVNTKLKQLTFNRPFWDLFYRWEKYEACVEHATDSAMLEHIALLDSIIRPEILPKVQHKQELERTNAMTYDYLWTLFEPGSEVCSGEGEDQVIERVHFCTYQPLPDGTPALQVHCRYVDYDGSAFGFRSSIRSICDFEGSRTMTDLSVVPLELHASREAITHALSERGQKFESLRGVQSKAYNGITMPGECGKRSQMLKHGRIMIDAQLYNSHCPRSGRLKPLRTRSAIVVPVEKPPQDLFDPFAGLDCGQTMPLSAAPVQAPEMGQEFQVADDKAVLQEEHYRLCCPKVRGYDLITKQWVEFYVNGVEDIQWNPAPFKRLYLPMDHKELILAFVESHMSQESRFDDVVEGKGQGMVMLLEGVPGVGKTLTAEAVAEEMRAPLYAMSAGQLGPNIEDVETTLRDVLDLCVGWNAVLLIDEADVFLERRHMTDIHRNKLVSIFLRTLEYYRGCLFLTTNRGLAFDAAFKSRIDLHIDYPNLDEAAKKHIWQTFVTPVQFPQNTSSLSDQDLNALAKLDLNGREIKNLVNIGRLLANRRGEELGMQHLRTVLSVQTAAPTIEPVELVYPPLD